MVIQKAVIPAAGQGIRLNPITKTVPKELLPVLNKPLIDYVIEELIDAGVTQIAIITSTKKPLIKEYLTSSSLLGKQTNKYRDVDLRFLHQEVPDGLGNSILQAKNFVGDNPFFVCLPDDLVFHHTSAVKQLQNTYKTLQDSLVGVVKVCTSEITKYGIVEPLDQSDGPSFKSKSFVEKPNPVDAPSDLAVIGRYLFSAGFTEILGKYSGLVPDDDLLTQAMNQLARENVISALHIEGTRIDAGSTLGITQAAIYELCQHSGSWNQLNSFLRTIQHRD